MKYKNRLNFIQDVKLYNPVWTSSGTPEAVYVGLSAELDDGVYKGIWELIVFG